MKIFQQETNKSCGVACLRSILNYYGNNFSEKDIWDKHEIYQGKDGGISNPVIGLGVTALKFGFNATYMGYNPVIINPSKEELKESLLKKSKTYFEHGKFSVDEALKFLELGGKIKIDLLDTEKIKKIIDKHKFVLVQIKPAFIHRRGSVNMNHKVIITGYNKKGFKILDPHDGKDHIWDYDKFLIAFYAAAAEILIIENKKK